MRIGEMTMRGESNLTLMLIVGICALLSLSTILVRSVGTIGKGGRVTADTTLADLRGTVPLDSEGNDGNQCILGACISVSLRAPRSATSFCECRKLTSVDKRRSK
jgi:hypothetical protein